MAGYATQEAARRNRKGGNYLFGAAALHALSIPVGLLLFKFLVEVQIGFSVTWAELFDALAQTGGMTIVIVGILGQAAFAVVAGLGALLLHRQRIAVAIPMIVVGVVALVFSLAIFGGLIGLIGGSLSIGGGLTAKPRPPAYPVPPPLGPPGPPYP
ncbi:MAG TPA: hypothetical protein VGR51_07195 [Thermoplasmata archaeon]|jgi:hypothetical protein|nr:hypothetical protein [Thermoplasmata archaeon]